MLPPWPKVGEAELARARPALYSTQDFDALAHSADVLCHLVYEMFLSLRLPPNLSITVQTLRHLILAVRELMFDRNPYHNWAHVADVTQTVFALAHSTGLMARLEPWDRFVLLASALCHDLEHPGVTTQFLDTAGVEVCPAPRLPRRGALRVNPQRGCCK